MNQLEAMVDEFGMAGSSVQTLFGDLVIGLSPNGAEDLVLTISRLAGRVQEREAVDIAVQLHRLLDRAGVPVDAEMLGYRDPDFGRCFVLKLRSTEAA